LGEHCLPDELSDEENGPYVKDADAKRRIWIYKKEALSDQGMRFYFNNSIMEFSGGFFTFVYVRRSCAYSLGKSV
jgi:hypothetical protein